MKLFFLLLGQAINFNDHVHTCPIIKMKSLRCKFKSILIKQKIDISFIKSLKHVITMPKCNLGYFIDMWWNECSLNSEKEWLFLNLIY
jgi:hypothetical protein